MPELPEVEIVKRSLKNTIELKDEIVKTYKSLEQEVVLMFRGCGILQAVKSVSIYFCCLCVKLFGRILWL